MAIDFPTRPDWLRLGAHVALGNLAGRIAGARPDGPSGEWEALVNFWPAEGSGWLPASRLTPVDPPPAGYRPWPYAIQTAEMLALWVA